MKAPQGFSITIQDLVSQASGEREQAEVILLSPLNYSQFLNIIKYRSQRNLFLTEDYLRMCSSAIRSIVRNPKSIHLWKYVKLHLLSSLGILLFLIHLDLMETLRKKNNFKVFLSCRTRLLFRSDFCSVSIRILEVSLWVAAKENRYSKQSWEICWFYLHQQSKSIEPCEK